MRIHRRGALRRLGGEILYNGIGAALPMHGTARISTTRITCIDGGMKIYNEDAWPCCSGSYIQAVADYPNLIYFHDRTSLYVNLFVPSTVLWNRDGEEVKVEQMTVFPEADATTLTLTPKRTLAFALKFRVPAWTRNVAVKVNDAELNIAAQPGTWAKIERTWSPGDRVTIRLPMQLRLSPIDAQHSNRVAAVYGPVVLVQGSETVAASVSDPTRWIAPQGGPLEFRSQQRSTGTFVPFYRVGQDSSYRMYFDVVA